MYFKPFNDLAFLTRSLLVHHQTYFPFFLAEQFVFLPCSALSACKVDVFKLALDSASYGHREINFESSDI